MCVELVPQSANFHTGGSQLTVLVLGLVCVVGCGVGGATFAVLALPWKHESLAGIAQVVCCSCSLSGSSVVKDLAVEIREPGQDHTGVVIKPCLDMKDGEKEEAYKIKDTKEEIIKKTSKDC